MVCKATGDPVPVLKIYPAADNYKKEVTGTTETETDGNSVESYITITEPYEFLKEKVFICHPNGAPIWNSLYIYMRHKHTKRLLP